MAPIPVSTATEQTRVGVLPVLRFPSLAPHVADVVITTRHGGVSRGPYESLNLGLHVGDDPDAVVENRTRAARAVGLTLDDLVFCRQAHGPNVAEVGASDRGRGARSHDDAIAETDALVTIAADVGLVVMVADCVPIVLLDPEAKVLACVHAGWRGTVARVTEVAVDRMVGLGATRASILAGVGPGIDGSRYQVGEDVLERATCAFGAAADTLVRPDGTGRWTFAVQTANVHLLAEAGVPAGNISVAPIGTSDAAFFSDRAVRPCGRFAAIARLRP